MPEIELSEKEKRTRYVRAAYAADGPGALSMIALLKENGIDAIRQGGTKDIYKIGGDVFGEEIMVAPENLHRAQELLQQFTGPASAPVSGPASVKKTLLALAAALILFFVLLFLRGRLMT